MPLWMFLFACHTTWDNPPPLAGVELLGFTQVVPSEGLPAEVLPDVSNNNLDVTWHDDRLFLAFRTGPSHFASTQTLEIFVDTPSPGDALEPDVLAAVAELQRRTAALPGVEAAYSLVDVLEEVRETMTGETGLPTTRAEVAQYLLLLEIGGADDLGQIVDFDRQTLRIAMRADTDGFRGVADIGLAAEAMAPEIVGELATVDATGLAFLIGDWLDEIFAGQRRGLALSAVLIGVMMMIALRSAPAGLASMLPNVLPLLCLGGWVGTMWDQVDSDTFIIAIVGLRMKEMSFISFVIP